MSDSIYIVFYFLQIKKNALENTNASTIIKTKIPTLYANLIIERINRNFHYFFLFLNSAKVKSFFVFCNISTKEIAN